MDLVELHRRASAGFGQLVEGVRDEQWDVPTPCAEWDVRALVHHLTEECRWVPELVAGRTVGDVGDELSGDLLGDDPKAAFTAARDEAVEALSAPDVSERTIHASFGDISGAHYLGQLFTDAVVHGWDLAAATGQDTHLHPDLVEVCYQISDAARAEIDGARAGGVFGPEVEVGAEASTQDRLLALFGRDPARWEQRSD